MKKASSGSSQRAWTRKVRPARAPLPTAPRRFKPSLDLLLTIFNRTSELIFILDREGKMLLCNDALATSLGCTPDILQGKPVLDFMPGEVGMGRRAAVERVLKSGQTEVLSDERDGRFFESVITPVFDRGGLVSHVTVFARDVTRQRQAQQALFASESLNRSIIEKASSGLVMVDRELRVQLWNPYMEQVSGLAADRVLGKKLPELFPFIQEFGLVAMLQRGLAGETAQTQDLPFLVPETGKSGWFTASIAPLPDAGGKVAGLIISVLDITQRKNAEAELRRSEERFAKVFHLTPVAVAISRFEDGAMVQVNDCFLRAFGWTREELIGRTSVAIGMLPNQARRQMLAQQVRRGEWRTPRELAVTNKARQTFCCLVAADMIELGGQPHILTVLLDITSRRQVEQALLLSEEKYRHLHESMRDAFARVDMAGRILETNRAYQEMLGYSQEELAQLTYQDLTPSKWRQLETRIVEEQILPQGHSRVYEKEYRRKDGTVFPVELRTFLLRDARGQPSGMWAIVRDITERQQAQEKLRESQEELRALAARIESIREEERARLSRVAHDHLGQNLTALKLDLAWLARHLGKSEPDIGQRLAAMISLVEDNVRTVQQISRDLRPPMLDELGLVEAIEWQTQEFERRSGIACRLKLDVRLARLGKEQSTALFRILQEALTNTARHAGATRVQVTLRQEPDAVSLEVRDNGCGIAPKKLTDHSALGLLGMRERALALGGEVVIERMPEGGTRVAARLPIAKTTTPPAGRHQRELQP